MYELFSILSGIALVLAAAFARSTKPKERLSFGVCGVAFIAYAIYVSNQTSGAYYFPIWIFIIPFIFAGYGLLSIASSANLTRPTQPGRTAPNNVRPGPSYTTAVSRVAAPPLTRIPLYCHGCGARLLQGARYCGQCGTSIS